MNLSIFRERWGVRLMVFALLCLVLLFLRLRTGSSTVTRDVPPSPAPPLSVSSTQIHADWQTAVRSVIVSYEQDQEAAKARDALLGLRVVSTDQDIHLRLVLALNALAEQAVGAGAKWQSAKQAFGAHP